MKHLTPARRRWVYSLALAAFPVLVFYGLVDPKAAPLWLGFALALLNVQDDAPDA